MTHKFTTIENLSKSSKNGFVVRGQDVILVTKSGDYLWVTFNFRTIQDKNIRR
jgi:hypothetical protein